MNHALFNKEDKLILEDGSEVEFIEDVYSCSPIAFGSFLVNRKHLDSTLDPSLYIHSMFKHPNSTKILFQVDQFRDPMVEAAIVHLLAKEKD